MDEEFEQNSAGFGKKASEAVSRNYPFALIVPGPAVAV
jgi:hypothetical protein